MGRVVRVGIVAVNMVLMHTGKVLMFSGRVHAGLDGARLGSGHRP